MRKTFLAAALVLGGLSSSQTAAQTAQWNSPGAGNPLIPGYFADPTIRKFGDTYYIYATTDATGNSSQPPQVWASKDFVNWRNIILNWPVTNLIWAPDVIEQPDGSYRYYYCTNECVVRVGESQSPVGPWHNRLGDPRAVLVPDRFVTNAITLDPNIFRDDDGSEYLYFGTWGIYPGFGCGVAKLSADGKSFTDKKLIVNTDIKDFFEAPWVFKRNGIYYFMYSSGYCENETYRVQYATSTTGPMGPFEYKGCILRTNADGTVHGPGHNSVLQDGDDYYIVYHRHNNPHSTGGFHRQVCIDRLTFDANGNILPVTPTHEGVIPASLAQTASALRARNLAAGAKATASSTYSDTYRADYAVDDNNGTMWRAADNEAPAALTIDLGRETAFDEVFTQFEYATFFYQYLIETSADGITWTTYADRTQNTEQGSPMVDTGQTQARFVRITITDTQKNGHFPAIWNVRIYQTTSSFDPLKMLPQPEVDEQTILASYPWLHRKDVEPSERAYTERRNHLLLDLDADYYQLGAVVEGVPVVAKDGKLAFRFNGIQRINLKDSVNFKTLTYNAPYTITAWILNPEVGNIETVAQFMPTDEKLGAITLNHGTNRQQGLISYNSSLHDIGMPEEMKPAIWQHWTISYDGYMTRVYLDGQQVSEKNGFLNLRPGTSVSIGADDAGRNPFTGYLHSLRLYDRAFTAEEAAQDYARPTATASTSTRIEGVVHRKLTLRTEPLSPQQVLVAVVDEQGQELTPGLFEYRFATGDEVALSRATTLNEGTTSLTLPAGTRSTTVYAAVSDVFGQQTQVVKAKVKRNAKDFEDKARNIDALAGGSVTLESGGSEMAADPEATCPMELTEVDGDFIVQCHVTDMSGLAQRRVTANDEGGVCIMSQAADGRKTIVHLGAFPEYDCGNILTVLHHGRPQSFNRTGYDFHPWLQLERRGSKIYARTSPDGITWTEMPASPVEAAFFDGKKLQAGIYQCTYTGNRASVSFDDVHIWKRK